MVSKHLHHLILRPLCNYLPWSVGCIYWHKIEHGRVMWRGFCDQGLKRGLLMFQILPRSSMGKPDALHKSLLCKDSSSKGPWPAKNQARRLGSGSSPTARLLRETTAIGILTYDWKFMWDLKKEAPTKRCPGLWLTFLWGKIFLFFKLLNSGVICYAAIDN